VGSLILSPCVPVDMGGYAPLALRRRCDVILIGPCGRHLGLLTPEWILPHPSVGLGSPADREKPRSIHGVRGVLARVGGSLPLSNVLLEPPTVSGGVILSVGVLSRLLLWRGLLLGWRGVLLLRELLVGPARGYSASRTPSGPVRVLLGQLGVLGCLCGSAGSAVAST
jgi:hypothetical protein